MMVKSSTRPKWNYLQHLLLLTYSCVNLLYLLRTCQRFATRFRMQSNCHQSLRVLNPRFNPSPNQFPTKCLLPSLSKHFKISIGFPKIFWSKRPYLQMNIVMHHAASVLHPIYQTIFPYLTSNRNTKFCIYVSSGSFCLLPMQFQEVCINNPFNGHDFNGK